MRSLSEREAIELTRMPKGAYVYHLIDPRTKCIRYVGRTDDPDRRHREHSENRSLSNNRKRAWIQELQQEGLTPTFEIVWCGEFYELAQREREEIEKQLAAGADLLNLACLTREQQAEFLDWQELGTSLKALSLISSRIFTAMCKISKKKSTLERQCFKLERLISDMKFGAEGLMLKTKRFDSSVCFRTMCGDFKEGGCDHG